MRWWTFDCFENYVRGLIFKFLEKKIKRSFKNLGKSLKNLDYIKDTFRFWITLKLFHLTSNIY